MESETPLPVCHAEWRGLGTREWKDSEVSPQMAYMSSCALEEGMQSRSFFELWVEEGNI